MVQFTSENWYDWCGSISILGLLCLALAEIVGDFRAEESRVAMSKRSLGWVLGLKLKNVDRLPKPTCAPMLCPPGPVNLSSLSGCSKLLCFCHHCTTKNPKHIMTSRHTLHVCQILDFCAGSRCSTHTISVVFGSHKQTLWWVQISVERPVTQMRCPWAKPSLRRLWSTRCQQRICLRTNYHVTARTEISLTVHRVPANPVVYHCTIIWPPWNSNLYTP